MTRIYSYVNPRGDVAFTATVGGTVREIVEHDTTIVAYAKCPTWQRVGEVRDMAGALRWMAGA